MGDAFLGEIRIFPFQVVPHGWAVCNGQLLEIRTHQALYSVLGTAYGGDGINNFALPNLQGRTPVHMHGSHPEGTAMGQRTTTLTASQLPPHTHLLMASTASADKATVAGNTLASPQTEAIYGSSAQSTALTTAINPSGQAQPYDNQQPYLVTVFCMAIDGISPTRT